MIQKETVANGLESEITGYEYYTLSGIKLSGKPAERGMIYIERAIMSDGRIESRKFLNK